MSGPIEAISAVTLLTADMAPAVAFYDALGFHLLYGGPSAAFTSFAAGSGFLNLQLDPAPAVRIVDLGSRDLLGRRRRRRLRPGRATRLGARDRAERRTVG